MNAAKATLPIAAATGLLLLGTIRLGAEQRPPALPQAHSALAARISSVLPQPSEERWLQIPWRTNLMRARAEAQRTNKPLFLWVMDGNPLGCT